MMTSVLGFLDQAAPQRPGIYPAEREHAHVEDDAAPAPTPTPAAAPTEA